MNKFYKYKIKHYELVNQYSGNPKKVTPHHKLVEEQKYIEEYKIQAIIYSPSKKSDKEDDFNNQRDKLYKAFISKTFPNVEYKTSKQGRIAMLPNVNEGTCGYDTNSETGEKLDTPGGISETGKSYPYGS